MGSVIVVIGGVLFLISRLSWFGRLPGDLMVDRGGFTIWIPLTTMFLVSLVLTFIFNLISRRF
ncbi:MAG: DUF2905 domain-containing protein [Candidatus Margulisbacteria bacterium]|nr:DUF2905 domain-containing protein [Candidatus Margulisiibacteriota bacterium]